VPDSNTITFGLTPSSLGPAVYQSAGGQNGEGFYETADNRRLESQIKFTF